MLEDLKMNRLAAWTLLLLSLGCSPVADEPEQVIAPEVSAPPIQVAESYPDPGTEVVQEVQDFLSGWVAERSGDEGIYTIPPRAGHDVAGHMADFHTIHQNDHDTYSVCIDFKSAEQLYDVDFFVDRTKEGLVVADHYLHKIDGEAVE
jgi:hypothetical protein